MSLSRRQFLERSIQGGLGLTALSFVGAAAQAVEASTISTPDYAGFLAGLSPAPTRYNGAVAVWFTSHYQIDSRDWDNIRTFGNEFHPLAGNYKSDAPGVLKKQLHWMRRAGIDTIVYDVFSTGLFKFTDLPKDKVLPMLVKELSDPQSEAHGMKLVIWLEKYWGIPTPAEYKYALDYVAENLAGHDFYFKYQGKPLVVCFLNAGVDDLDDTLEPYRARFNIRYIRPEKSDFWSYIDHTPQQVRKGWMCASPGMDSYLEDAYITHIVRKQTNPSLDEVRAHAQRMLRRGGATFVEQLQWATKHDPAIIFLSGWNDWQYDCQIEPSVEYRFHYLDIASKMLGRWDETARFRDEA